MSHRVWNDHTSHSRWKNLPGLLWSHWLCSHHFIFQSVLGENNNSVGFCSQILLWSPTATERSFTSQQQTRLERREAKSWRQPCRVEALGVLCDVDPLRCSNNHFLLCFGHVFLNRGMGIFGFTLLLLCGIQHHWFRGYGQQPASQLRKPSRLPNRQFLLYFNGRLLHLLAVQCHLYCHQAGAQLAPEKASDTMPSLPWEVSPAP